MDEGPREVFREFGQTRWFEAGTLICEPRRPLEGAYGVESGFITMNDRAELDLERLGLLLEEGDTFGEYALLEPPLRRSYRTRARAEVPPEPQPRGGPYPSSLRALTDVHASFLDAKAFRKAAAARPQVDLRAWLRSQVVLKENLARLVLALRALEDLAGTPTPALVAAAQHGTAIRIGPGGAAHVARAETSLIYVVSGRLSCGQAGSLLRADELLRPLTEAWIVEIAVPGWPPRRQRGASKAGRKGPRVIVFWSDSLAPEVISAVTAHVAALQQGEPGRPESWRGSLLRLDAPTDLTPPQASAERSGVNVVPGSRGKVDTLLKRAATPVVYLDASGCPRDWIDTELQSRDWTVVNLGARGGAPPPFRPGRLVNTTILATRSEDGVTAVLEGAQRFLRATFDEHFGSEEEAYAAAFVPRTVRLRFHDLAALPHRSTPELADGDRRSLARIARALAGRRVGVALGGGGAWGYAHIALLEALTERKVAIDAVSGVSFGSLVGAYYAVGDLARVQTLITGWPGVLGSMLGGLAVPPVVEWFLLGQLRGRLLEDLEVPFYPVALNLQRGEWAPDHGSVAFAVRASSSLPGLFSPAIRPGIRAIDGAYINNVPEGVLVRQGMDVVIASNVAKSPEPAPRPWWPLSWTLSPTQRMKDNVRGLGWLMKVADERDRKDNHWHFEPHEPALLDGFEPWQLWKGRDISRAVLQEAADVAERVQRDWLGRWN